MMKKIMAIAMAALLLPSVAFADVDVGVGIETTGDVDFNADINTTGDVFVTIDGTNYPQVWDSMSRSIDIVGETSLSLDSLIKNFGSGVAWYYGKVQDAPWQIEVFIKQLSAIFMPRNEANYKFNLLYNMTQQQQIDIAALKVAVNAIDPDAYCDGRKSAMKDYNLTSIECDGTTWYNDGIGITPGVE